jgi:hypothetical protein
VRCDGPAGVVWDDEHVTTTPATVEFRARSGRVMTVAVALLCGWALVDTLLDDAGVGLRTLPALVLPAVLVWAFVGRPAVLVSDGGVELRNVLRTIELPWTSIQRVDTKYALTLYTAYGDFAAWAAPAPGRMTTLNAAPADVPTLPESPDIGGGVRPGDLFGSPSGEAAAYVRRRWFELRDAGYLDEARLEHVRPRVRWHTGPILAVTLLAAAAVVGLLSVRGSL